MIQVKFDFGYYSSVDGWCLNRPDSGGYVSVRASIKNLSEKTIKYCSLFFTPYNAVGDSVCSIYGNESEVCLKLTGPLSANEIAKNVIWEAVWHNPTITKIVLNKVDIDYMDGSSETIRGSQIETLILTSKGGCYIATAVYGSYDCPQVWTLRRFRDYTLAETWYGRAFIRTYYAISPTLVKWFGKTEWFQRIWRSTLDHMVANLQAKGVKNTPYKDRNW